MKRKLFILFAVCFLVGCSLEEFRQEDCSSDGLSFSLDEAREFFETDYSCRLTKSDGVHLRPVSKLHPGDFTPLWENSVYSESGGFASYDVSMLSERKAVAIRSRFGPEGSRAEKLRVYQKLVVSRNMKTGGMSSYVLSLIPDVGCDDVRIPERFLSRGKDKGCFSGIAVYATTDRGALVRVQQYEHGVKLQDVYLPSGSGSYVDRCVKVREILCGMKLLSCLNVHTRSGEDSWEDDYWYDDHPIELNEWWVGHFEEIGPGVYTDGNGSYYVDDDGDGIIDYEAGYVEDDYPEEPDPPTTPPAPEPGENDGQDEEIQEDLPNGDIPSDYDDLTPEQIISIKMNNLIISLGNDLGSVKLGLSVVLGTPNGSPFASIDLNGQDLWAKQRDYTIVISDGLNDIQQSLVLAHEFMHLKLFQISQDALKREQAPHILKRSRRAYGRYRLAN